MIDIHSHILPSLDDGARDLDDSLRLAQLAVEEGITAIIATPHHENGNYLNPASAVHDAAQALQSALQERNIPLDLHIGQEIRVFGNLLSDYDEGLLLTLAGSAYLLLEFPSGDIPRDIANLLYELKLLGITPIIAHPERNRILMNDFNQLIGLIEAGALCQMTSHSLNGFFGRTVQKASMDMCKMNLIHFVSSDAHHPVNRAFGLRQAYQVVASELGESVRDYYMRNASAVLMSETIEPRPPVMKRNIWNLFRRN